MKNTIIIYHQSFIKILVSLFYLNGYHAVSQNQIQQNSDNNLPVYQCFKIDSDIKITGKADDVLWEKAKEIKLINPVTGKPGKFSTSVKMLYNETYLYIAFECEDNSVWGTHTQRDTKIFDEECVEVFLCPSGKFRQYYEINVSPLNTIFDAFILNIGPVQSGSPIRHWFDYSCEGLVTMVSINGTLGKPGAKGWIVEYAIPFMSVIGSDNLVPQTGEEWRMNVCRIDRPASNQMDLYSWAPMGSKGFHQSWLFGKLKFIDNE